MEAKITKEEARDLIEKQLKSKTLAAGRKHDCWHYGKMELVELLDAIYGKEER